jgi:hypothetical protein
MTELRTRYEFWCPHCHTAGDERGHHGSDLPNARYSHYCPHNHNRQTDFQRVDKEPT